ncbi:hypothetical protein GCM10022209_55750 [Chitinophaga oryziterrae]
MILKIKCNLYRNKDNILEWWKKSRERDRYNDELNLPEKPHISNWKIGDKNFLGRQDLIIHIRISDKKR